MEHVNIGNAINLQTGVFTAPIKGRYAFGFSAKTDWTGTSVTLRHNGVNVGSSYTLPLKTNIPLQANLNLKIGDQVSIYLNDGVLFDSLNMHTYFTGILLEEDLIF